MGVMARRIADDQIDAVVDPTREVEVALRGQVQQLRRFGSGAVEPGNEHIARSRHYRR